MSQQNFTFTFAFILNFDFSLKMSVSHFDFLSESTFWAEKFKDKWSVHSFCLIFFAKISRTHNIDANENKPDWRLSGN